MKNNLMTSLVWVAFKQSFYNNLPMLGVTDKKAFMSKAKCVYKRIILKITEYGKNDVLKNTIMNASVLAAAYLSLETKPSVEVMREYYKKSMCDNRIAVATIRADKMYTEKYQDIDGLKAEDVKVNIEKVFETVAKAKEKSEITLTYIEYFALLLILECESRERKKAPTFDSLFTENGFSLLKYTKNFTVFSENTTTTEFSQKSKWLEAINSLAEKSLIEIKGKGKHVSFSSAENTKEIFCDSQTLFKFLLIVNGKKELFRATKNYGIVKESADDESVSFVCGPQVGADIII